MVSYRVCYSRDRGIPYIVMGCDCHARYRRACHGVINRSRHCIANKRRVESAFAYILHSDVAKPNLK